VSVLPAIRSHPAQLQTFLVLLADVLEAFGVLGALAAIGAIITWPRLLLTCCTLQPFWMKSMRILILGVLRWRLVLLCILGGACPICSLKVSCLAKNGLTSNLGVGHANLINCLQPVSVGFSRIVMLAIGAHHCIRILLSACQVEELVGKFVEVNLYFGALMHEAEVLLIVLGDSKCAEQLFDASDFLRLFGFNVEKLLRLNLHSSIILLSGWMLRLVRFLWRVLRAFILYLRRLPQGELSIHVQHHDRLLFIYIDIECWRCVGSLLNIELRHLLFLPI
jgi:hypothetical protein